jgi:DNA-binding GntR family transcriptional regulator
LEPRARINELELCARFGISRTPLREAIKVLSTEGLLELLPNRGARVTSISDAELEEMLEVIAGLEATAAELACRRVTEEALTDIAAKHRAMVDAYKRLDQAAYFTLNREIHDAIVAASGNTTLAGIYTNLAGRIQRARYSAHKTPAQWKQAVDEHEEMVRLLRGRDGQRLASLMRKHVLSKAPVIAAAYGESANPPRRRDGGQTDGSHSIKASRRRSSMQ